MMRYVSLASPVAPNYLRESANGQVDFDGDGIGPETIWLREIADDNAVRLRNLAHGRYLAPGNGSTDNCVMLPKSDDRTLWVEVASDDGNYFSYRSIHNTFLTATEWAGFGPKSGDSGHTADTRLSTISVPTGDGAIMMFLSYVPPDALLPWPQNGRGSVEEYIERNKNVVVHHPFPLGTLDRKGREQLARELQLTIEPERTLIGRWKTIEEATKNEIDVSGNLEH